MVPEHHSLFKSKANVLSTELDGQMKGKAVPQPYTATTTFKIIIVINDLQLHTLQAAYFRCS